MTAIRTFFRHIRNGFRNLFRNIWMTTVSILTMTVTLFMVGGFVMLLLNVNNILTDIEEGVNIRTHIDVAADEEDEAQLKSEIEAIPYVNQVTYRTRDEELSDLISNVGEEFELFSDDNNPLFNVFIVSVEDTQYLAQVSEEIQQLPFAEEVSYGEIDTENLINTLEVVRIVLALISAVMVVIAVSLIVNTIKMSIFARQNEIEIMRLVGAENSYIRAPFAYEGAFIGIISGIIASLLLYAAYEGLQSATVQFIGVQVIRFTPTMPYVLYVSGGLLIIGVVLGVLGASRSMKKFLTI